MSQSPPEQQNKTPEEIKELERKKRLAIDTLWRKAILSWKLDANQKEMYKFATETDHQILVIGSSRQLGKCLAEGTEVLTVNRGIVPIEQLTTEDYVYGYNKDNSISPSRVVTVIDSGMKEVVDLVNVGQVFATCTEDHSWLVSSDDGAVFECKTRDFDETIYIEQRSFHSSDKSRIKIKKENPRREPCYDISIDNETSLYLLANGLITHNSYFLTVLAIETCLKSPNVIVKFIAPKTKDIKRIIAPIVKEVSADCPKDLRPQYKMHDNTYIFHNGSEIQLAGTDNGHAESIRGNKAHICIIDEAGFCDDLRYIVNSILIPTTTMTGGKIIMSSTPSRSPDHDFMSFMEEAEHDGRFIKRTIYDNPRLTAEQIDRIAEGLGGKHTTDFRREYLVEKITSEDDAVVPEFTKDLQAKIVKPTTTPPFFDAYVSMDIGVKDMTVVLFAFYDFINSKIVIQDEIVMQGAKMLTDDLAAKIKDKERALWLDPISSEPREPFIRVADNNNLILLNDLTIKHRLNFIASEKDSKVAMINHMRQLLRQEQVIIDPKCTTLISHLEGAIWNRARDSFARSRDKAHYDAVDACLYLVRMMTKYMSKNPYPIDYKYNFGEKSQVFRKEVNNQASTPIEKTLVKTFSVRRKSPWSRY